MRATRFAIVLAAGLSLSACAGMTPEQQTAGMGALGGAAVGGLLGSFTGDAGIGALLGAGVGGVGGYLYEQSRRR